MRRLHGKTSDPKLTTNTQPPLRAATGETALARPPARSQSSFPAFGTLRAALVSNLPGMLDMLGCNSTRVLRRAGIPRKLLANPENQVGYHAVGRLLEETVRATGLTHLGVLAGESFAPADALGDVGELMQNSPTIQLALRTFILHHHMNDSGAVPMLIRSGQRRATLAHSIYWHDVPAIEVFYDAAVAYGMQIMRLLCGKNWLPRQVLLARRRPTDVAPYERMFGPNIRFDAHIHAIEVNSTLLDRPVAGADPARFAMLQDEIRQRERREHLSLSVQVRRAIRPMIVAGTASIADIATLFSMHERVLRARLATEGVSVRQLIREARLEMASQLLRSTQLPVNEISGAVGYADPPSFVRAFRSHFSGVTPGEWRAQSASGAR